MSRPNIPNVIFIISDQIKATAVRRYSPIGIATPGLERLADEGTRFEYAFTPHPLCVPARVSMMTGRYSHSTGCRRNETLMPPNQLHTVRIWKSLGLMTGLIGKNHCFIDRSDLDLLDVRCELSHRGLPSAERPYLGEIPGTQGMDWVVPEDRIAASHTRRNNMPRQTSRISYAVTDFDLEGYSTEAITRQTEAFVAERAKDGAPFGLIVSYPDPHSPLEVPRKYAEMVLPEDVTLPPLGRDTWALLPQRNRILHDFLGLENEPEEEIRNMLAIYLAMVRFVDDGVTRILDALVNAGLRRNTIVVFTADHGDFACEHSMMGKGGVFYDALVRVPLIVSWPQGGVPSGSVDSSMTNTVDILPTLLQLQGVADFTTEKSAPGPYDLAAPGPSVPGNLQNPIVNSESLRQLQGLPLPTITPAAPRLAAFSEYGAGGAPFDVDKMKSLPQPVGPRSIMESLWIREAEGRRRMVRTSHWKFVTDPDRSVAGRLHGGSETEDELYDLDEDPWELRNIAGDGRHDDVISDMRALLLTWMSRTEEGEPVPQPSRWWGSQIPGVQPE